MSEGGSGPGDCEGYCDAPVFRASVFVGTEEQNPEPDREPEAALPPGPGQELGRTL